MLAPGNDMPISFRKSESATLKDLGDISADRHQNWRGRLADASVLAECAA